MPLLDSTTQDAIDSLPMGGYFIVKVIHERHLTSPTEVEAFLKMHNASMTSIEQECNTMDIAYMSHSQIWSYEILYSCKEAQNFGVNIDFNSITNFDLKNMTQTVKEKLTDKEIIERYEEIIKKRQENSTPTGLDDYANIEI